MSPELDAVDSNHSQPAKNVDRKIPVYAITGLFLLAAITLLGMYLLKIGPFGTPQFHGTLLEPPGAVTDFTLTGHTGEPVSLSDFRGRLVLLYFGYTYCPDVCPTTLAKLVQVKNELGADGDDLQVVMVSVDPDRDTPESMAKYLDYFDSTFVGLSGSHEDLAAATVPLGVFYAKEAGTVASGYLVDHTASVFVINRDGNLRLLLSLDTAKEDVAADLRYLLKE